MLVANLPVSTGDVLAFAYDRGNMERAAGQAEDFDRWPCYFSTTTFS